MDLLRAGFKPIKKTRNGILYADNCGLFKVDISKGKHKGVEALFSDKQTALEFLNHPNQF